MPSSLILAAFAALAALAADPVQVQLNTLKQPIVQQRLEAVKRDIRERRQTLAAMYAEVGCEVSSQPVPGSKEPNLFFPL